MPVPHLFEALLEGSADHIYVVDRECRYTHVSRGGAEAVGLTREKMKGRTWRELGLPADTMEPVEQEWRNVLATGTVLQRAVSYDTPAGKRHFEYSAAPVRENGQIISVLVISRDISKRVAAEEEVIRARERYRGFVENSSEAIWRFELDTPIDTTLPVDVQIEQSFARGYLAECNDAMARMYGYARAEDIAGARLPDMLDPNDETNRGFLREFIRGGYRLIDAESAEVGRDGSRKYFLNTFIGIVQDGELLRAWGTQRDVTEQRLFNEAERDRSVFIAEANDLFAQSLDYERTLRNLALMAVPRLADWCAVDMVDADGSVRRLAVQHPDPEMLKLAFDLQEKYPGDPDSPRGLPGVIRSGRTDWIRLIPDELIERAAVNAEHLAMLRKLQLKSYICTPIKVRERIAGVLTLVKSGQSRPYDEADVRLAEALALRAGYAIENATAYREAIDASRSKDEFLATVSHELRTPLTAVLGWANLVRLSNYDIETMRSAVTMIERSAKAQAALIDDLLDVSRIIMGKFSLNRTAVDIVPIITDVIAATTPAAEAKKIAIAVNAPKSLVIHADANRIQQIVWNLMSNAVKFSSARGHIDIDLTRDATAAVLRITDEGIGIAADLLPRVFDRFWQADSATNRSHGGLGLGLAIVKHLTEMHGGTVSAESAGNGRGATFTVRVPVGEVDGQTGKESPSTTASISS
jgi:PAS domain S-box-containing protein